MDYQYANVFFYLISMKGERNISLILSMYTDGEQNFYKCSNYNTGIDM